MHIYGTLAFALVTGCGNGVADQPEAPLNYAVANEATKRSSASIEPDLIGRDTIEKYNLSDAGCSVPAEENEGFLIIARMEDAHFLLDGKLVSLAPHSGTETLLYGVSTHYDGLNYSAEISIDRESQRALGPETWDYDGRLMIRDTTRQIVFTHTGTIRCGA